ncbi:MAG: fibronectin type III domain-containing protein [Euryarchaeota archaeon]|nr:fibronectin type III domain-containing protein [Euryarchaeota archaeon]MDE1879441.1 fibronectin type III domain-containing protein [Euryarchaeota archaeon]
MTAPVAGASHSPPPSLVRETPVPMLGVPTLMGSSCAFGNLTGGVPVDPTQGLLVAWLVGTVAADGGYSVPLVYSNDHRQFATLGFVQSHFIPGGSYNRYSEVLVLRSNGETSMTVNTTWPLTAPGDILCVDSLSGAGSIVQYSAAKNASTTVTAAASGSLTTVGNDSLVLTQVASNGTSVSSVGKPWMTSLNYTHGTDGNGQVMEATQYSASIATISTNTTEGATLNSPQYWMWLTVAVSPASYALHTTVLTNLGGAVKGASVSVAVVCASLPAEVSTCAADETAVTGTTGQANFTGLPYGQPLWVWSNRSALYSGASTRVSLTTTPTSLTLKEVRLHPVSEHSYVLPRWNNLSTYADNANCDLLRTCSGSGSTPQGTQVPILAWSQDGVFYVDSQNNVTFYSFANRSAQTVGPWTPLYDNVMNYRGVEDTEWMTQDSQYVYEFGCLSESACAAGAATLTVYLVNVTTGAHYEHNFTGTKTTVANLQVNLVGMNGAYTTAAVVNATGVVYGWNWSNGTEWKMGKLNYPFEANNVYWVPELNSWIQVVAGGTSTDVVAQYRLTNAGRIVGAWHSTFDTSFTVNGVQGIVYNLTAHTIDFTYAYNSTDYHTARYSILPNGTLNVETAKFVESFPSDVQAGSPLGYSVTSSEHRISLISWGPSYAAWTDAQFFNGSFSTWQSGNWSGSNITYANVPQKGPYANGAIQPSSVEGMFYTAERGLVEAGLDCRTNQSKCGLNGNGSGATRPGTVTYYWPYGGTVFPYLPASAKAELYPPSVPRDLSLLPLTSSSLAVSWNPPASGANPILNYTLFYGTTTAYGHAVSVAGVNATRYTLTGLTPLTKYYILLRATNLHGVGVGVNSSVYTNYPAAPQGLVVTAVNTSSVTLSWVNPSQSGITYTNNSVYWGASCSSLGSQANTTGNRTTYTVVGLSPDTNYCFEVTIWAGALQSGSALVLANTAPLPSNPPPANITKGPVTTDPTVPPPIPPAQLSCNGGCLLGTLITIGAGVYFLLAVPRQRPWISLFIMGGGMLAATSYLAPLL